MSNKTNPNHARMIRPSLNKLESLGYQSNLLFKGTGLILSELDNPATHISLQQELTFVRNIISTKKDPLIGLKLGEAFPPEAHGALGYAALSASTLAQALSIAASYSELTYSQFNITYTVDENGSRFSFVKKRALEESVQNFYIDRDISAAKTSINRLTAATLPLSKVSLAHKEFNLGKEYEAYFGCPVDFDPDANASWIKIDEKILNQTLPQQDSETSEFCEMQCKKIIQKLSHQSHFVDEVRSTIIAKPSIFPSIDDVSKKLNMSTSTLRRRLNDEGNNYQTILNEIRYNLAKDYLTFSSMPLEKISDLLGYSDPGNFTHAFKKWSGKSPRIWRNDNPAS